MIIMSLRDGVLPSKQSPVTRGDFSATCARNDMQTASLVSLRELQSASGEELRPFFGRTLLPSVLDRAFKGELCPPSRPSPKWGKGNVMYL
jgi:hypothetical protein